MVDKISLYVRFGGSYLPYAVDKCTAARSVKHGLMEHVSEFPNPGLLLYPFAETSLTSYDRTLAETHGICLIDAPWYVLPLMNSQLGEGIVRRKLVNVREVQGPYKGSNWKISTAGAAAYSLFVIGFVNQAEEILSIFPWKEDFIRENFIKGEKK